ncbi:hypothetical protein [Vibrio sp. T11.5]|uniref:hypothetical protein n=1 Tax=Vibrio sp. T11.5 TaxID=2998836 RepID=UPI0022CD7FCE|nr:hypothetical protein [Vibrio sp. T11.5]MDA0118569.1 hypothetical protein [Vibrio sp. T11.5]
MVAVLELLMLTIPWLVFSLVRSERLSATLACGLILPSFIIFLVGLISGWLCAIGVINLNWPASTIFVGNQWWNLATGPIVIMLYLFVMSEVCTLKRYDGRY